MTRLKERVEWLREDVGRLSITVNGSGFSGGLLVEVKKLKRDVDRIDHAVTMIMEYLEVDVDMGDGPKLVKRKPVEGGA